jgi:hypothetical protein
MESNPVWQKDADLHCIAQTVSFAIVFCVVFGRFGDPVRHDLECTLSDTDQAHAILQLLERVDPKRR